MIFIAKSNDDDAERSGVWSALGVRPLSLGDTAAKIIAAALYRPLAALAQRTVGFHQRGFVRGRNLLDNVLEAESAAIGFSKLDSSAALLAFDFRAAFPSISHEWIFFVLVGMCIPVFFLDALRGLYNGIECVVCFGHSRERIITVTCGIKQGCPLSGSVFALCIEPFLLRLLAMLPSPRARLSARGRRLRLLRYLHPPGRE